MNILITGGAGFIGSNLSVALVARGHVVTVLDNLSPQIHGGDSISLTSIDKEVRFILGDVRNKDNLLTALNGQDVVVHFAAETGTGQSMYQIEHYVDVNVRGTAQLLDILANHSHGISRIVLASSRSIYGEGRYNCPNHAIVYPQARFLNDMEKGDFNVKCPYCKANVEPLATTEDSQIHPTSVYGITKYNQEQMMLNIGTALGIPTISLRYQNVYGPGQSLINPYTGILSIFSTRIQNGNEIIVFEDGKESRDFVYIDDVVAATVASIEHADSGQHAINIGSGVRTSVLDVANSLVSAYGVKVPIRVTGAFRMGDIRDNFADITKAGSLLKYVPKVDLATGILRFVNWVKSQSLNPDAYEKSISEMRARGFLK